MDNWTNKITVEDLDEPYYEIAKKLGIEVAKEIANMFQGSQIYFPRVEKSCDPVRKELIKKEFNGYNYKELAIKYGYSERWIREICREDIEKARNKPIKNQVSFFEE